PGGPGARGPTPPASGRRSRAERHRSRRGAQIHAEDIDGDGEARGWACCGSRARARLRQRLEGGQGRRQDSARNDLAEILERVQQAQEGGRHVEGGVQWDCSTISEAWWDKS